MMTVECKISIDWIEDGSVDEIIQDKIVKEAVAQIGKSIQKQVDVMAVEILETRVNAMIDDIWVNFIDKRVNFMDKYGDIVETHDSVKDMLKARLDGFLNQRVDKDGKPFGVDKCGYNSTPRVEWLMNKVLKDHTEPFLKNVQALFDAKLKDMLNRSMQERISASILKNVDVSSLINAVKEA